MKVLLFTTPTCIKCKSFKPIVEKVCLENDVTLEVLNAIGEAELRDKYNIQSVPFIVFNKDGVDLHTHNGVMTEKEILEIINS